MAGRLRATDGFTLRRLARGESIEGRQQGLIRPPLDDVPTAVGLDESGRFPEEFFLRPVTEVARALLGSVLLSLVDGVRALAVVTETEAYAGPEDAASHAATRSGVTRRNRAMFGPPGRAYVYRSYGVHWCLNVVTGSEGAGQAVLLRGAAPIEGHDVMRARRSGRTPLCAGPGRLAQALGVTDALYGHPLTRPPLLLLPGWSVADERTGASGRIGVGVAEELPWRFYVRGAPGVSRHPR